MGTVLYEASIGYGTIVSALAIPFVLILGIILISRLA